MCAAAHYQLSSFLRLPHTHDSSCFLCYSQIANLKEALQNGDLGPAEFDTQFQQIWLSMKKDDSGESLEDKRRARQSMQAQQRSSTYAAVDED